MNTTPEVANFNRGTRDLIDSASEFFEFPDLHYHTFRRGFTNESEGLSGEGTLWLGAHLRRFSMSTRTLKTHEADAIIAEIKIQLAADPFNSPDHAAAYFERKGFPDLGDLEITGQEAIQPSREHLESLKALKEVGSLVLTEFQDGLLVDYQEPKY